MKNSKSGEVRHGVTCIKAEHGPQGGYLHDADDDWPYDVDGALYCGRCHCYLYPAKGSATVNRQGMFMATALKPCPFCGTALDINAPGVFQTSGGGKWGAVSCCCTGPEVRTDGKPVEHWRDAAIAAWNERSDGKRGLERRRAFFWRLANFANDAALADDDSAMDLVLESIRMLIAEASNE